MAHNPYSLSFTTGTLMLTESVLLTEQYLELGSWQKVRERVKQNNLLQGKTMKSTMTLMSEIISSLRFLSDKQVRRLSRAPEKNLICSKMIVIMKDSEGLILQLLSILAGMQMHENSRYDNPDKQAQLLLHQEVLIVLYLKDRKRTICLVRNVLSQEKRS